MPWALPWGFVHLFIHWWMPTVRGSSQDGSQVLQLGMGIVCRWYWDCTWLQRTRFTRHLVALAVFISCVFTQHIIILDMKTEASHHTRVHSDSFPSLLKALWLPLIYLDQKIADILQSTVLSLLIVRISCMRAEYLEPWLHSPQFLTQVDSSPMPHTLQPPKIIAL